MTTKRFVKLQFVLILMFTLTIICNTFSWSTRPAEEGGAYMTTATELNNGISYWTALKLETPTYYINGNSCTAVTYAADIDGSGNALFNKQGNVIYDETTPITSTAEIELSPDDVYYFKTVVTNTSDVTTNTSLFIDVIYHTELNTSMHVGVTTPVTKAGSISTKDAADKTTQMHTVSWVPVLSGIEIKKGITNIEWSVYSTSPDKTRTFSITDIHFTNN